MTSGQQGCLWVSLLACHWSHLLWEQSKLKVSYWKITHFSRFYRNSWPVTPYVKSIGYWVSMCYCLVFYCILEYCVILSLKKTFSNNQTGTSMDFGEEKRIRIALNIEKISQICVPIYLFSFSVGYFIIMSNFNFWKISFFFSSQNTSWCLSTWHLALRPI